MTDLAGCGKSRDFGETVMKRARNGNPGLIKSTGYEGQKATNRAGSTTDRLFPQPARTILVNFRRQPANIDPHPAGPDQRSEPNRPADPGTIHNLSRSAAGGEGAADGAGGRSPAGPCGPGDRCNPVAQMGRHYPHPCGIGAPSARATYSTHGGLWFRPHHFGVLVTSLPIRLSRGL